MRQTTAAGVAFVDQATTDVGGLHTRYQITNATYRYWDSTQAVTVKKNAVIQTSGFTIEHLSGFVVFDAPLLGTDVVLVSGTALTVAEVAGMFGWKLDPNLDLEDTTSFADNGWKSFTPTLNGFTGSAEAYWVNGDHQALLAAGADVIFLLYVDDGASKRRYEAFGQIKKIGTELPVKGVVKENVEFEGTGQLFYREG